ncbi:MAG: hypothetical protein EAX96_06910 [Candidatus Lokiarchaeota archaeon]|nr:hypothetical protein [Candidatus Lokiarchaeota archaeon]
MEEPKVKTGIPELDDLIGGGFVNPSVILLLGQPGSGKTNFSLKYLFEGVKHNERGIFFSTLSESSSSLIEFGSNFYFFNSKMIGRKIFVIDLSNKIEEFKKSQQFLDEITEKIEKFNISRMVIDPINPINLALPDIKEYRMFLFKFARIIKEFKIQALITAELYDFNYLHCHEAYISDGTILLDKIFKQKKMVREMTIVKMRGTAHRLDPIEYTFTKHGMTLNLKK